MCKINPPSPLTCVSENLTLSFSKEPRWWDLWCYLERHWRLCANLYFFLSFWPQHLRYTIEGLGKPSIEGTFDVCLYIFDDIFFHCHLFLSLSSLQAEWFVVWNANVAYSQSFVFRCMGLGFNDRQRDCFWTHKSERYSEVKDLEDFMIVLRVVPCAVRHNCHDLWWLVTHCNCNKSWYTDMNSS